MISAIDVEGDAVAFSGVKSGSVNYTFSVNSQSGAVTVTPPTGYVGTMDVLLRVKAAGTTDTADTYDTQLVPIVVAPAAPMAVDLVAASDSGYLNTDNLTNLTDLTFEVTGVTSGAQVRLYQGSTVIGQATASGISVTITTSSLAGLGDGAHTVYATQVVNSVESNASPQLTVTLDKTVPPAFTSTPPTAATIGTPLTYDAQNPEEGTTGAAYSLTNAPAGVSINAASGLLTWTPTGSQLGAHAFAIVMTDAAGNSRSQDLSIQVAADALMAFRLEVANTSGTPISSIDVGGDFLLKVFVQDLRAPAYGVFAAFLDVLYNQQLVAVNGSLSYGAEFPQSARRESRDRRPDRRGGGVGRDDRARRQRIPAVEPSDARDSRRRGVVYVRSRRQSAVGRGVALPHRDRVAVGRYQLRVHLADRQSRLRSQRRLVPGGRRQSQHVAQSAGQ